MGGARKGAECRLRPGQLAGSSASRLQLRGQVVHALLGQVAVARSLRRTVHKVCIKLSLWLAHLGQVWSTPIRIHGMFMWHSQETSRNMLPV